MENQLKSTSGERVILQLPGISKKWVRSNRQWVDMSELPSRHEQHQSNWEEAQSVVKKWWQFWKK